MSHKFKPKSDKEIISILKHFGFEIHSQRGSHVKLRRIKSDGEKQTLTIVTHDELDIGTQHSIFKQACRYIPENELKNFFI